MEEVTELGKRRSDQRTARFIRPEITLTMLGSEFTLCHTGASQTVVHPNDVPGLIRDKSQQYMIFVKSANG